MIEMIAICDKLPRHKSTDRQLIDDYGRFKFNIIISKLHM